MGFDRKFAADGNCGVISDLRQVASIVCSVYGFPGAFTELNNVPAVACCSLNRVDFNHVLTFRVGWQPLAASDGL